MTHGLAAFGLMLVAWVSFAALISVLVTLAWRATATRFGAWHSRRRAAFALGAALAPFGGSTLLLALSLAPGFAGLVGGHDHCLAHDGHPHLCLVHRTAILDGPTMAALALGALAAAFLTARARQLLARTRRFVEVLRASSHRAPGCDYAIAPSAKPFSFVSGFLHPEIWVSSALVDRLEPDELEVVLHHERAHRTRRDPLRRALVELLSFPLGPRTRREIIEAFVIASEQTCDETAGQRTGSRLRVAETLLSVEKATSSSAPGIPTMQPAFGGSHVAPRVASLLEPVAPEPERAWFGWWMGAALIAMLLLAIDSIHHGTEHWLRFLLASH